MAEAVLCTDLCGTDLFGFVRLPPTHLIINQNLKIMKQLLEKFGEFNNWKGCVGLYFNTKKLRQIAKEINVPYKDIKFMQIKEVYDLYV